MAESVPSRVLWLTNLQAPYRESMWAELASLVILQVGFLGSSHRQRDWSWTPRREYSSESGLGMEVPSRNPDESLYVARGLKRAIREFDTLVLGGWESPAYWQAMWWARRYGLSTVVFAEFGPNSSRFTSPRNPVVAARGHFFRSCDAVLTSGEASTVRVLEMQVSPSRVVTGFNTVDNSTIRSTVQELRASSEESPRGDGHVFVFVGRLIERKNVGALLGAFHVARAPGDTLLVVGDGPQREVLQEQARAQGMQDAVSFAGHVSSPDVARFLARAHTLVLPSLAETWGMVVNEALSCGLQVVTTPHVGAGTSVRSMEGVYVSSGTDRHSLALAMREARSRWRGYIDEPEILRFGPSYSASRAAAAISLSRDVASRDRK